MAVTSAVGDVLRTPGGGLGALRELTFASLTVARDVRHRGDAGETRFLIAIH